MSHFRESKDNFQTDSSDSETDNIELLTRNILRKMNPSSNTSNSTAATNNAAAVTIDINLIKYFSEFIPEFNGNQLELRQYIAQVENTFLETPQEAHKFVFAHARQKLKGAAKITCAGRTELNTWDALKERLISLYSCTDTIETLENKMNQSYPKPNESLLSFGSRLQHIRSQIIDKIHFSNEDPNRAILKIEFCETNAKNRFVTFIPERYQTEIKLAEPSSLEQAIDIFSGLEQEHENRIAQRNLTNSVQRQNNNSKPPFPNNNFRPNRNNHFNNQNPGPSNPNQNFSNKFSNRPFPIQPMPKFPKPGQAFNNPQRPNHNRHNAFAPQRNFRPNYQTPMSGISNGQRMFNVPPEQKQTPMSGIENFNIENNRFNQPNYYNEYYSDNLQYDNQDYPYFGNNYPADNLEQNANTQDFPETDGENPGT